MAVLNVVWYGRQMNNRQNHNALPLQDLLKTQKEKDRAKIPQIWKSLLATTWPSAWTREKTNFKCWHAPRLFDMVFILP